jgi:uncharacterized protein (TIGR00725 family)
MNSMMVAVIGPGSCSDEQAKLAERVGELLAEERAVLICGGKGGVMEAACRGASERGGITIGILPGTDRDSGNRFLTVPIPTGLGEARNAIVAQAGQAIIAIGGGPGTLSEIALGIKAGIPVFALGSWKASQSDGQPLGAIYVDTPEQAVELALREVG